MMFVCTLRKGKNKKNKGESFFFFFFLQNRKSSARESKKKNKYQTFLDLLNSNFGRASTRFISSSRIQPASHMFRFFFFTKRKSNRKKLTTSTADFLKPGRSGDSPASLPPPFLPRSLPPQKYSSRPPRPSRQRAAPSGS